MDTERYCTSLDKLDPVKAIRAAHFALIQLKATREAAMAESYDNAPAIEALTECLKDAGHIGFTQ